MTKEQPAGLQKRVEKETVAVQKAGSLREVPRKATRPGHVDLYATLKGAQLLLLLT